MPDKKVDTIKESADDYYILYFPERHLHRMGGQNALSGLPTYAKGPDWTVINGYFRLTTRESLTTSATCMIVPASPLASGPIR